MGDNFDTIIYIIISIVAFVISTLGKKKKRNAKRSPYKPNQEDSQTQKKPFLSNFEQLLKEEIGITEPNYQNDFAVDSRNEDYIHEDDKEELLDQDPEKEIHNNDKVPYSVEYDDTDEILKNPIQKKDLTITEEKPIISDFNLRDAIIYSEILNRKEY